MKLTNYTAKKGYDSKLTVKGVTGSYKSNGQTNEVIMTFEFENGEELRDELEIAKECNSKVRQALDNLHNPNTEWLGEGGGMEDTERKSDGYTESKGKWGDRK